MKFINILNENISNLGNPFYRKCLNLFSINHPELKDYFLTRTNCSDCHQINSIEKTHPFRVIKNFFLNELHLSVEQTNDLIFLYIINLNVDNFLTDELSTGEEYTLSYISCTDDDISEDFRDSSYQCDNCDGEGSIECGDCDGSGNLNCGYCDGEGSIETDEEQEEIETNCRDCGGSGNETCNNCDGQGWETCDNCGGQGYFDDEETYYTLSEILYTVLSKGVLKDSGSGYVADFFDINKDNIYIITKETVSEIHEELDESNLPDSDTVFEVESYENYVTKFGTVGIF
jgi:hypothetical protein